jgi:actin-fragmin kinase-like protein
VLFDTPGSRTPAKYTFKTAPYDQQHQEYLGGYAEWGFEVELGDGGLARIKPGSEHVAIQDEMWDDYTATAEQAKRNFYDVWTRRNTERRRRNPRLELPGLEEVEGRPRGERRERDPRYDLPDLSFLNEWHQPPRGERREPSLIDLPSLEELERAPREQGPRSLFEDRSRFRVTAYGPGQLGVYFMDGPGGEAVVKPIESVFNELVALEIAKVLQIPQPDTRAIRADSQEGAAFIEAILASPHKKEYLRHFAETPPKFFLVMDHVPGQTLEKAQEKGIGRPIDQESVARFVRDLGRITAFDILLHYRDRTSINGGGNLANLIVTPELRAVAIDQRVNVRTTGHFGSSPVEDIGSLVTGLREGDEERLQALWDNLPAEIQEALGSRKSGIDALRASVLAGLERVVTRLKPDQFSEIGERLKGFKLPPPSKSSYGPFSPLPPGVGSDHVDFEALTGSWKAIAAALEGLL